MRFVVPVLLLALAALTLLGSEGTPLERGNARGDGSAATTALERKGPSLAPGLRASPVHDEATDAEPGASIVPADLPAWGFLCRVTRPGTSERLPAPGVRLSLTLAGMEAIAWEVEGRTDEEGRCRLGPVVLPPLPPRLQTGLALVLESEFEGAVATPWREDLRLQWALVRQGSAGQSDAAGVWWWPLDLQVRGGFTLHGRLLTHSGHPVDGVYVNTTSPYTGLSTSDRDGRFHLHVEREGSVTLEADITGCFLARCETTVRAIEGQGVEIRFPEDGEVRGRVVDPDGVGLAGIHLVLAAHTWEPNGGLQLVSHGYTPPDAKARLRTLSASDGTFAFPGLEQDTPYELWWPADDDRWEKLDRAVRPGEHDLLVTLERRGLRVQLVEAGSGRPVAGTSRIVRVREDDDFLSRLRMSDAVPAEAGRIGAPGDRFRIHAFARGYALTTVEYAVPEARGREVLPVEMVPLSPPTVVRIRCVDQRGKPVGPVPLLYRAALESREELALPVAADEARDVLVHRDLPPGVLRLETCDRLGHPPNGRWRFTMQVEEEIEIPEGEGEFDVDLVCPQGGSVRLTLAKTKEQSERVEAVCLRDARGDETSPWWYADLGGGLWDFEILSRSHWRPDGRSYECSVLPEGPWTLVVRGGTAWEDLEIPLRITAGEVTEIRASLVPRR